MNKLIGHLRANVIAYLALFVALGGTGYAAIRLSKHSINPVNFNSRQIGGYVREWATVGASGKVSASGGHVRVLPDPGIAPGHYIVDWSPRPNTPCEVSGSVDLIGAGGTAVPGYVETSSGSSPGRGEQTAIQIYDAQGQPTALAFDVQLICSTPR
jgi:hypothetical protein